MSVDTSKMSEGKRATMELAEGARDLLRDDPSFAAGLFMGRALWPLVWPFPEQSADDHLAGMPFLADLERVLREHVDPDEVGRSGEISDDAVRELAKIGAFGIKIPLRYSGLGLSQTNYCRAIMLLGSYCGSTMARIVTHQSMGMSQSLLVSGTEEQKKKYLPRVAKGEMSVFDLTKTGVGSDPARMDTLADPDGQHFVIKDDCLALSASCVGLTRRCLTLARKWASEREHRGASNGHHAMIADKIARMASDLFAMEAMTLLASAHVDDGKADIRMEVAMCKMWCTEAAWRVANDTVQIHGGRGYETASPLQAHGEDRVAIERIMRDARVNLLFREPSDLMRLYIAREALDPHSRRAQPVMNGGLVSRIKAAGAAALFYGRWYPRQWIPRRGALPDVSDPVLRAHVLYIARTSRRLARALFHSMARHGPKLEREQLTLARYVEIGTELFAMAAACSRAQWMLLHDAHGRQALTLADQFCRGSCARIAEGFRAQRGNCDRAGYRLAQSVLKGEYNWLTTDIVT